MSDMQPKEAELGNIEVGVTRVGDVLVRIDDMEVSMTPEMAKWFAVELTNAAVRAETVMRQRVTK